MSDVPMLNARDISRRLNVSRATAYREMKKMVHVVVGRRSVRVAETALEAYLRRNTETPSTVRAKAEGSDRHLRIVYPRTQPKEEAAG